MATGNNGELTWSGTNGFTVRVMWSETYDTSSNTSIVTINSIEAKSSSYSGFAYYLNGTIKINGSTIVTMNSYDGTHNVTISTLNTYSTIKASGGTPVTCSLANISHNTDGSKSIAIELDLAFYEKNYKGGNGGKVTGAKTINLTTIPRASTFDSLSCSTSYLNGEFTYKYSPQSASFYNLINIYIKNESGTYDNIKTIKIGKKAAAQQTGTITLSSSELSSIYSKLPASTKGVVRFTLRTYSDSSYSTKVGNTQTKEKTLSLPADIKPYLGDVLLDPVNIVTADGISRNILVQGKNKITISVSDCSAGAGSSIKSYTFSGPNISTTTTNTSVTSNSVISNTETLTYTVQVTDARERTDSKTATIICYEYSAPYFESFSAYKANANGVADENGSYIKCNYTLGYSSVNSTNNVTVKILYKKNTDPNYSSVNSISESTNVSGSSLLGSIDPTSSYIVYATITDNYNGSASSTTVNIFGESRILNITEDGTGLAIGKMAESSHLFECRWDAKFGNNVSCVEIECDSVAAGQVSCDDIAINGKTLLNLIYPVGSIYMSVNSVSPSSFLGGTWERLKDRFLLASGDSYAAGATGGEASHTLTTNEMPSHTHTQKSCTNPGDHTHNISTWYESSSGSAQTVEGWSNKAHQQYHSTTAAGGHTHTITLNNTGGGKAHNNMPPYLSVYMWKRTA